MKVVVAQRISALKGAKRLTKLAEILESHGISYVLVHAARGGDEELPWRTHSLVAPPRGRLQRILHPLIWCAFLLAYTLRRRRESAVYHCVGLDSTLSVLAATAGTRSHVIFDNIDNLWMSYHWPRPFAAVLRTLEQFAVRHSSVHIVPNAARWPNGDQRTTVVPNSPHTAVLQRARTLATIRGYSRPSSFLTIYVNGWLRSSRGVDQLLDACELLSSRSIRIKVLVAGEPECASARRLVRQPYTEYLGVLSNEEALAQYFRSSIAFIYYDPTLPINRVADSNKWWDCVATETPFIVNEEVTTAKAFFQNGSFAVPYSRTSQLVAMLETLSADPEMLDEARAHLRRHFIEMWDVAMWRIYERVLPQNSD